MSRQRVYEAIAHGACTEADIARKTGLTVTQARAVTGSLLWDGLLIMGVDGLRVISPIFTVNHYPSPRRYLPGVG